MADTRRLVVSIVNWNTRVELARCLTALRAAVAGLDAEVHVVDNASSDGSAAMVARDFPEVVCHPQTTNLGFAGGNNVVLSTRDADLALLLNPDVEPSGPAIRRMLAFLDEVPGAAGVSPVLVGPDGRPQEFMYRRFPTLKQLLLFWTVLGPLSRRIAPLRRAIMEYDLRGETPVAVDQLPGGAVLLRVDALREIGPWDPGFFLWFEDVDWSYRARRAGYSLFVLPTARMSHVGGASFHGWSTTSRVFQFYRAYARFVHKHRIARLERWSLPLLRADLVMKEAALRVAATLGAGSRGDPRLLGLARGAMRDVTDRSRRGQVPDFTTAEIATEDE